MDYNELNGFIYNYLQYDRTNRAILLKGDWGSGKSYYIKNVLKPFLESDENEYKYKCTIVSLYGLNDLSEISKAIYFESRKVIREPQSEIGNTGKIVGKIIGKTVFNGLVSKIGFDIGSIDEEDLLKLYESVDLSRNLVILEDIERSKIDIFEIFGYVNNLCEYDQAKVMLVTNEKEFVETVFVERNDKKVSEYTTKTKEYLRKKEKTVGDTIDFICDYKDAISQILSDFLYLKKYDTQNSISEIVNLYGKKINLRSFILACQKTENILEYVHNHNIAIDKIVDKVIFFGIIGFVQKRDEAQYISFDPHASLSSNLGVNDKYPLFKFCYDYVVFQKFSDPEIIRKTAQLYSDYCRNSKWNSGKDEDLVIIKNYYIQEENKLVQAIDNIQRKLKQGVISFYDYGVLANYLVLIQYDVGIDAKLDNIESLMVNSLKNREDSLGIISFFSENNPLENKEAYDRFIRFKVSLEKAMAKFDDSDLVYEPERFIKFCRNYRYLRFRNVGERVLFRIVPEQFENMIKMCDSSQLDEIRLFFQNIYLIDNGYDDEVLGNLQEISNWISSESFENFDKIQKLQIRRMKDLLDNVLQQSK